MRVPWPRRHPADEAAAERGRALEVRTRHAEDAALVAISEAQRAEARQQRLIRQNHLAPRIAAALRESR